MSSSTPRVRRTVQNTQFTYNLPRRIHTVHTYPVLSPQGATILIYGHENGLTIVWRGGRRFKPEANEPAAKTPNGAQNGPSSTDVVMIIDSDDEDGPSNEPFVDTPQFEDSTDDDASYPEIIQTLDLEFQSAIHHISSLPFIPCPAEDASWEGTDVLKEKMLFAVSCMTREVFLVTLPLTPPSPSSKARKELQQSLLAGKAGNGKWGETLTFLSGQEKASDGLAMTLVRPRSNLDRRSAERSRSISRYHHVIVAAHTREACGTLRLWDVPLEIAGKSGSVIAPFQTEYLSRPLVSISFNPTHSSQLLCNASPNAVRIYDYNAASMPPDDISEGPFPSQGSWLISFYPPFTRHSGTRKPVVSASWVVRGRAIFVLLADGQWGIWDVDGVSPRGSARSRGSGCGILGDAITAFSVTGYVEGTNSLRATVPQRVSGGAAEFVPMTPHTRRDAFSSIGPERLATVRGGAVVTPLPRNTNTAADESLTFWIGSSDHVFTIPGLLKFWDAQIRKSAGGGVNLFSGAQPTRMIRLTDLSVGLMGEACTGVSAVVRFAETQGQSSPGSEGLPVDVVICGETRLVIVRESEEAVGTRIGGVVSRGNRLSGVHDNSAIVVYPKPEQPGSVAYNLSFGPRKKLSRPLSSGGLDQSPTAGVMQSERRKSPAQKPPPLIGSFSFAESMSAAADYGQQSEEEERDVEIEMLDIMEIDRELEAMNDGRGRGRKKVVFES